MLTELKPCPFCGMQPEEPDVGDYFVECPRCGVRGPIANKDGRPHAKEEWNRRAIEAEVLHAQEPVAQNYWRDVSDELPKEAQEVLFVRDGKTKFGAWIGGIFWHSNEKMVAAKWMPLPSPDSAPQPPVPCPKCAKQPPCTNEHVAEDYEFGTLAARDATIAQQAERIAELEHAIDTAMIVACIGVFNPGDDPKIALHKFGAWSESVGAFFAQEKLNEQATLIEKCEKDASRYQWLRAQHWSHSDVAVARHPMESIKLGYDCPSDSRLDELIDEALAAIAAHQK